MRIAKLTIVVVLIIAIFAALCYGAFFYVKPLLSKAKTEQLSTKQKLEDFDYLYNTMKQNYPFFEVKKRMLNYDWLGNKDEFRKRIANTKNDKEFYNEIYKMVNLAQNAHTHVLSGDFYYELKDIYENPHSAYSPARRDILNNEKAIEMADYWSTKLTAYNNYIPIIFRYIEGKYVVLDGNLEPYEIEQGSILTKVNGVNIDEYIQSLNEKMYLYYDYQRKQQKLDELILYTEPNTELELTLVTPEQQTIVEVVEEESFSYEIIEKYYEISETDKNYELQILEENKIAYIRLKSMMVSDRFSSDKDKDVIYEFLQKVKDYPNLIVDIRGNGGGSDGYWRNNLVAFLINKHTFYDAHLLFKDSEYIKPFIEERYSLFEAKTTDQLPKDKNYPPEAQNDLRYFVTSTNDVVPFNPVKFKGEIFLLVDGGVYSAAESFASFAKSTKWATLVGTTTGGDGIIADPALMLLPNSGIVVRFSSCMGLNPDGTANEEYHTAPDIYVEQSYEDFLQQIRSEEEFTDSVGKYDTVINHVLNMIKNN